MRLARPFRPNLYPRPPRNTLGTRKRNDRPLRATAISVASDDAGDRIRAGYRIVFPWPGSEGQELQIVVALSGNVLPDRRGSGDQGQHP